MKPPRQQSGIALLSVMLVLTLMILTAAEITFSYRLQVRRNGALHQAEQARWYALSAEELAIKVLQDDLGDSERVHLDQNWATHDVSFPVEHGMISGHISDSQACLNLNALDKPDTEEGQPAVELLVFQSLLESLDVPSYKADIITQSTRDWVSDSFVKASSLGADDSDYLSRPVPYLAANTPMRDISEWRAVNGVTASIARKTMPFLCALPSSAMKMNVNTLQEDQPELLTALFLGELPVEQAIDLMAQRPKQGWNSIEEFLAEPLLANFSTSQSRELMGIDSQYFETSATAEFADSTVHLRSLLRLANDDDFRVIRRQFGEPG